MKTVENSICAPMGFKALGKNCGIKKGKLDLAVIYSEKPCAAAGVFTRNKVSGAPLHITKKHLADGRAQAIVINSGIANVLTGKQGKADALMMAELTAQELGLKPHDVLVASTGKIAVMLPMDCVTSGLKGIKADLSTDASGAAEGILTTDTFAKQIAVKGEGFTVGAIAKGSGMIHPNMATMLCFITTDAKLEHKELQNMLATSVDGSFNMLSVDMDTSTSDMVLVLANGLAGVPDKKQFHDALTFVCCAMAKAIAKDGEGATKLIISYVKGAASKNDARKAARAIICSPLVKCAFYGNDPNWGRIASAVGNSGCQLDEAGLSVAIGSIQLMNKGAIASYDEAKASAEMKKDEVAITVDLGLGDFSATAYGCDLGPKYVEINALYRT
ncbi:TPA: bifunctional glutamate N-acetyltransferase/amino-acid acetyltransferase ArgJ [Candidatus Woesearchaeota archaeon]|nr:bifunctional glutamate N-acetyltransferase/amino-acid acetyltransferase ArgJ [Candidatus Woesearchaeota archaeon]